MTMDEEMDWKSESKGLRLRHRPSMWGFLILIGTRNKKCDYITNTMSGRLMPSCSGGCLFASVADIFGSSNYSDSCNITCLRSAVVHALLCRKERGTSNSQNAETHATLETTMSCTTSYLLLGETFALKLSSILTSFRRHWGLDSAIVIHAECRGILLRLPWAFRAELVASYSNPSLAECFRLGQLVIKLMLTSVLDQSSQENRHRNSARTSRHLLRMCQR